MFFLFVIQTETDREKVSIVKEMECEAFHIILKGMMRPTYKVRYTEWPPWAMDIPVGNKTILYGVLKDVFEALSYSLNYQFEIHSQVDHQFGALQADGSYSGMLGALHKKVHLC
ncbi:hypothetical protein TNCT_338341 [Trichonephila clavata]|uniref:Ionotropic glutamate receptor L-glutamate and glycine-binding domain-containing protein n=1 Tax=Trichonephila clavata TaxID=2740835 RepID=A0A8X6G9W3_TRICU|nr:hypothetical protein TNCT_338341 [Trichonephila clavata]